MENKDKESVSAGKKAKWEKPEVIEISEKYTAACAYGNQPGAVCSDGRGATGYSCSSGVQEQP